MKKCYIHLFGCSHTSIGPFADWDNNDGRGDLISLFKEKGYDDIEINNHGLGGASNDIIIDEVYKRTKTYEYQQMTDDVFYIIQYSYTNRLWLPNTPYNIHFNGTTINGEGISNTRSDAKLPEEYIDIVGLFYRTFIGFFYDDTLYFEDLTKKIDFLIKFLNSYKNIKFIHFLYDGFANMEEIKKDISIEEIIDTKNINQYFTEKCRQLGLVHFENNFYNFKKIVSDKKLTIWHKTNGKVKDFHLSAEGNNYLKNLLLYEINQKLKK
jgi:hypothetical protein